METEKDFYMAVAIHPGAFAAKQRMKKMEIGKQYVQYREDQLEKLGNTAVYLSDHISDLSKTKLLKLLYLLDERSILEKRQ